MDVWDTVNVGKRWTEEDGTSREEVEYSAHWQVTIKGDPGPVLLRCVTPEVQRQVADQLEDILDNMLKKAAEETDGGA